MEFIASQQDRSFVKSLLFQQHIPSTKLVVSVIIPVKNEAAHLHITLDALRLQRHPSGQLLDPDSYEVLLLANNCTDESFKIAQQYGELFPDFKLLVAEICLPEKFANIGTARSMLMDEACQRLIAVGNQQGIIASTDGDSEVDQCWIYNIIKEINRGNDAVGGRIITKRYDHQSDYYLRDEIYRSLVAKAESIADPLEHDPWPRHFQYFGANLAVTCKMYQKVGGLPQLPWLEDEALYKALVRADARIRKSMNVMVTTSDRQEGRVAIGFSQQLREWAEMKKENQQQLVPSAEELITKFSCRRALRLCWSANIKFSLFDKEDLSRIANALSVDAEWLHGEMIASKYFGKLWENVESQMHSEQCALKWSAVPIDGAIAALQLYTELKD